MRLAGGVIFLLVGCVSTGPHFHERRSCVRGNTQDVHDQLVVAREHKDSINKEYWAYCYGPDATDDILCYDLGKTVEDLEYQEMHLEQEYRRLCK